MESELTPKQAKFATLYVKLGNATEAYKKVYSTANQKPETINRNAKTMLDNSKISARIAEIRSKIEQTDLYTLERIIGAFGQIAFADITDVFDFDNEKNKIFLKGGAKQLSELPRSITGCIQSLKQTRDGIEVKLYAKDNALAQIARIKGYFAPDRVITAEASFADLLK